jgi:FkbM family methyltransferase
MLERAYSGFLQPGDVCVDVGAHRGRHTFPLSDLVGPTGKVLAFEPIPHVARALQESLTGRAGNVELHQAALSDTTGRATFVLVHELPEYSGFRKRIYDAPVTTEEIEVSLSRLDEFEGQLEGLRFIKIDCEGGELQVLRGAQRVLDSFRPIVSFESGDNSLVNYPYASADIYDFFHAAGYRLESITGTALDRGGFIEASARQEFWDYLALPA